MTIRELIEQNGHSGKEVLDTEIGSSRYGTSVYASARWSEYGVEITIELTPKAPALKAAA